MSKKQFITNYEEPKGHPDNLKTAICCCLCHTQVNLARPQGHILVLTRCGFKSEKMSTCDSALIIIFPEVSHYIWLHQIHVSVSLLVKGSLLVILNTTLTQGTVNKFININSSRHNVFLITSKSVFKYLSKFRQKAQYLCLPDVHKMLPQTSYPCDRPPQPSSNIPFSFAGDKKLLLLNHYIVDTQILEIFHSKDHLLPYFFLPVGIRNVEAKRTLQGVFVNIALHVFVTTI